jgi:hypothetical protein
MKVRFEEKYTLEAGKYQEAYIPSDAFPASVDVPPTDVGVSPPADVGIPLPPGVYERLRKTHIHNQGNSIRYRFCTLSHVLS